MLVSRMQPVSANGMSLCQTEGQTSGQPKAGYLALVAGRLSLWCIDITLSVAAEGNVRTDYRITFLS